MGTFQLCMTWTVGVLQAVCSVMITVVLVWTLLDSVRLGGCRQHIGHIMRVIRVCVTFYRHVEHLQ